MSGIQRTHVEAITCISLPTAWPAGHSVSDMDSDQWREWKYEQAKKLDQAIAFLLRQLSFTVSAAV